jgi:hypothetical protein
MLISSEKYKIKNKNKKIHNVLFLDKRAHKYKRK